MCTIVSTHDIGEAHMNAKTEKIKRMIALLEETPSMTVDELAEELDAGKTTVHRYLRECNIKLYKRGGDPLKTQIEDLYFSGLPMAIICDKLGVSKALLFFYKNKYNIPNRIDEEPVTTTLEEVQVHLVIAYDQLLKKDKVRNYVRKSNSGDLMVNTLVNTKNSFQTQRLVKFTMNAVQSALKGTQTDDLIKQVGAMPHLYTGMCIYRSSTFVTRDDAHLVIAQALHNEDYDLTLFMPISTIINSARLLLFKKFDIGVTYDNLV